MVVDTSALVAHVLEASIVLQRRLDDAGVSELDAFLEKLGVVVLPVTRATAILARDAFRRFGKGRHPAALNFGDCFSSALAVERGEPLLFVGDDVARTNVGVAPY